MPDPPRSECARTGARSAAFRTSIDAPSHGGIDEDDHRGAGAAAAAASGLRVISGEEQARETADEKMDEK